MTAHTFTDAIRAGWPNATDAQCDWVMWERTPWPIGGVTLRDAYRAASGYRRSFENGITLCDLCHSKAVNGSRIVPLCARHAEELS